MSSVPLQLILIRHPEPEVAPGVCYGQWDVGLRDGWERAIDQVATRLEALLEESLEPPPVAIFTSPLRRCRRPAQRLAEHFHRPVREYGDLKELSFGEWEGRAWEDFDGPESRHWAEDFVCRRPPGGESFRELQSRVLATLEQELPPSGPVVMLGHAGPIRALLAKHHQRDLARAMDFEVPYLSLTRLSWDTTDR